MKKATCTVAGCDRPAKKARLCHAHWRQEQEGQPFTPPAEDQRFVPVEVRFWRRVDKTSTCWLWTGPLFEGYGRIKLDSKAWPAHRMAWTLLRGPIPLGMQIDHMCRNRACVNPEHLQVVPQALNAQNRSRYWPGSKSGLRGVSWHQNCKKWQVRVGDGHGGRITVGMFADLAEAEAAAIEARNRIMTNNLEDRRDAA